MSEVDTGGIARDAVRLRAIGTPLTEVVRAGVTYGATRAEYGWSHSLATLADCLTMAAAFEDPLSTLPVIQGLATVSRTEVRRPARRQPDPLDFVASCGSVADGLAAFPVLVDAEQGEEAEALLHGLLVSGASPGAIRHAFLTAITDHFLGYGHPIIYCQKAFDLLDQIRWRRPTRCWRRWCRRSPGPPGTTGSRTCAGSCKPGEQLMAMPPCPADGRGPVEAWTL
jgi:hypothetical protein